MINYKQYILNHWNEYGIVDSREDMIKLLNVLGSHGESLDTLHDVTMGNTEFCCQIWFRGAVDDREIAQTILDYHIFFTTYGEMIAHFKEDADYMGETLEERMQYEDIRKTEDGFVVCLEC